jgi:hypothetical protein
MSRRRKNAGLGYGMMFHGAFATKADAKKKERQVGGFIQPRNIKGARRYVVMSERKNPIRRKNKAKANPTELMVMGANPKTHEIQAKPGEVITIRVNPIPLSNPSAAALRERFTGRETDRITTRREPHMPEGDYAQLGKLLALYVKPHSGGQVQMIKPKGTIVVSDESARQLYFVGGDQDVTESLAVFGAVDRGAGLFELGEARRIDYQQRKEHVPDPDADEWRHDFGEETGVRPKVLFDVNHKRLLLEGGEYVVRAEGIVN